MAGAVVNYVVKRIGDFLIQEAVFQYELRDQVERLGDELRRMQSFLKDADAKRKRDERVKNWVRDVRDAAYEAEDLLDSFILHAEAWRRRTEGFTGAARCLVCLPCHLFTRHRFGEEIQLMRAKIRDISDSRSTYGIENLGGDAGDSGYIHRRVEEQRRISLHTDSDVVGMEDETKNILKLLFDEGVKRRSVISIVGMGGLGKTTLAKKIYNTMEIQSRFDRFCWITVSQQYTAVQLLKDMGKKVAGLKEEEMGKMSREELEEKLYNHLKGRQYLIIMDDVWDNHVWDIVKVVLPDVVNGSRVLITTRSIDVGRAADPCMEPYELRFLNDEESWELFSKKVFPNQDVGAVCTGELEQLGRQIAKKCGGLPLALVVLGGMLSRKDKSPVVWGKLAETVGWQHSEDGQMCLEILALSYNDLPHHLKWCFLYLGSLPEDFEIDVEKLTRLWIAEGFVERREGETPEETADHYMGELILRCLVQIAERSSYVSAEKCRIHDLLRDLSMLEAKEIAFFECHGNPDHAPSASSVRRLSLHKGMENHISLSHSTPRLRTLLGFNFHSPSMVHLIKGLKLLRVIDLQGAPVQVLPEEIGDAVLLRYLGLKRTQIKHLPSSLGKLHHLQTLDAAQTLIINVPDSVWSIKTLRHINVPTAVEPRIVDGSLSDLHVLDKPRAGSWIGSSLARLSKLQKLAITGISESHHESLSSSLEKLSRLNSLELTGQSIPSSALALSNLPRLYALMLYGQLATPLQPYTSDQLPSCLTQINLYSTRMDQDPLALLERLPDLKMLLLLKDSYMGKEMVCSCNGFPRLQYFTLEYVGELESWRVEDGAMPCLRNLRITSCMKLKMLPQGLQHMLALQQFTLRNMPDEFYSRVRKGEGEDWHKIQNIRSIVINNQKIQ